MGEDMHGIRPENLSDEELVRYAWLSDPAHLSPDWVTELIKRFEQKLDDLK